MTDVLDRPAPAPTAGAIPTPAPPRPLPLACKLCGTPHPASPSATCEECLGPLEPVYDPGRALPDAATIAGRAPSLWRYREWLPFEGDPVVSLDSGFTPLLDAPALGPPSRRGAGVDQERRGLASLAQLQGPGGRHRAQCRPRPRPRHGRLRLDRQPRQRGRRAGRAGGSPGLDLHPARSRAWEGRGHRGLRPAPRARPRHVRRRQSALRAGGRPIRLGAREHQPSRLLRRRLEDDGVRDRGAARLAAADRRGGADGRRLAADQAGEGFPRVPGRGAGGRSDAAALRRAGVGLRADRGSGRARRRDT